MKQVAVYMADQDISLIDWNKDIKIGKPHSRTQFLMCPTLFIRRKASSTAVYTTNCVFWYIPLDILFLRTEVKIR